MLKLLKLEISVGFLAVILKLFSYTMFKAWKSVFLHSTTEMSFNQVDKYLVDNQRSQIPKLQTVQGGINYLFSTLSAGISLLFSFSKNDCCKMAIFISLPPKKH